MSLPWAARGLKIPYVDRSDRQSRRGHGHCTQLLSQEARDTRDVRSPIGVLLGLRGRPCRLPTLAAHHKHGSN